MILLALFFKIQTCGSRGQTSPVNMSTNNVTHLKDAQLILVDRLTEALGKWHQNCRTVD